MADVGMAQVVEFTQQLVRMQSLSGQEGKVASLVQEWMAALGFDDVQVDIYGNVIGRIDGQGGEGGARRLLLDGHIDTVAPVQLGDWSDDPFSATLKENRIYGLGSADMKGSLAAMVIAIAGLPRMSFSGSIFVSASVGEEILEGAALASVVELTKPDFVVIGEATDFRLGTSQRGRAGIIVDTLGIATHSSQPDLGENAVYKMARVITGLRGMNLPSDAILGDGIMELIDIQSSPFPSRSIVPSKCRARYDRRLVLSETPESVILGIRECLDDIQGVEVRLNEESLLCYTGNELKDIDFHPAWSVPANSDIVRKCQAVLDEIGLPEEPIAIQYCSNGSYSAGVADIPTVIFGPPSIEQAHGIDEFIEIDDLTQAVDCFQRISIALLGE
jgi:putative selenium metabolism hydrolase